METNFHQKKKFLDLKTNSLTNQFQTQYTKQICMLRGD